MLPVADTHADEPYRFAWQLAVQKKRPRLSEDHPFVVGWNSELVLSGMSLKIFEANPQCHDQAEFRQARGAVS